MSRPEMQTMAFQLPEPSTAATGNPGQTANPVMTAAVTQEAFHLKQENENLRANLEAAQRALDDMTVDFMSVREKLETTLATASVPQPTVNPIPDEHHGLVLQTQALGGARHQIEQLQLAASEKDNTILRLQSSLETAQAQTRQTTQFSPAKSPPSPLQLRLQAIDKDREVTSLRKTLARVNSESQQHQALALELQAQLSSMQQIQVMDARMMEVKADGEKDALQKQVEFFRTKCEETTLWAQNEIKTRQKLEVELAAKNEQLQGQVSLVKDLQRLLEGQGVGGLS